MAPRGAQRGVLLIAVLSTGAGLAAGSVHAAQSFPCRWDWSLFDGLRQGYVTAGNTADCAGRQGSLTLSVRLLRQDPSTKTWRTVKTSSKTFKHISRTRSVEVATPCTAASFRGVFRWTLRDTRGV